MLVVTCDISYISARRWETVKESVEEFALVYITGVISCYTLAAVSKKRLSNFQSKVRARFKYLSLTDLLFVSPWTPVLENWTPALLLNFRTRFGPLSTTKVVHYLRTRIIPSCFWLFSCIMIEISHSRAFIRVIMHWEKRNFYDCIAPRRELSFRQTRWQSCVRAILGH